MTMESLARLAGVTRSTVSKAFSGSSEISDETRARIFALAREHGVYDKYCKRTSKKPVIGVICPEFEGGLYPQWLVWLQKEIAARGGIMVAAADGFSVQGCEELLAYFTECMKPDGIIVCRRLDTKKLATPIVTIGESEGMDCVCVSKTAAFAEAIRHLKENGHTSIACLTEKRTEITMQHFLRAMAENGLAADEKLIFETNLRFEEGGYDAMEKLFASQMRPSAVFAAYDNMAFGAMKCITDHGYCVPEDFSVISIDDAVTSSYMNVPLTSITVYNEDLCQIVVDTLFDRIRLGDSTPPKKIRVSGTLVQRDSVGKAPKKS